MDAESKISSPNSSSGAHSTRVRVPPSMTARLKDFPQPEPAGVRKYDAYREFLFTDEAAKYLIAIVDGEVENQLHGDGLEWVSLHAWRILLQNKCEAALPALIDCLAHSNDDDWAKDDIHRGLVDFGPVVVTPICEYLHQETIFAQDVFGFAALTEVLSEIVGRHPDQKAAVGKTIQGLLEKFETLPPIFNSFVILAPAEIQDDSAGPLIRRIFERRFLDEEIADLSWIKEKIPAAHLPPSIAEDRYKPNNFHYGGDEKFQKTLKALGATINVDEVKFMIVASFLAVDVVQPSAIASVITDDADKEDGGFQSEGQTLYFYRELFALWNSLAKFQNEIFPLSDPDLKSLAEEPVKVIQVLKLFRFQMHLTSFSQGLAMGNTTEENYPGTDIADFVEWVERTLAQLEEILDAKNYAPEIMDRALTEAREYWDANYMKFANDCRAHRRREFERLKFVEEHKHVGRNEPCPCGSGQKFKKCCLESISP